MWIIITGAIASLMALIMLFAPWRVIGRWNGGHLELSLRFLGMTFTLWKRDIFAHPVRVTKNSEARAERVNDKPIAQLIDHIQALIDNRETLLHAGRLLLRLARKFSGWWHLEESRIDITIGLGNPAHTGVAIGALSAIGGIIGSRWPKLRIQGLANFDSLTLHSRGEVIVRIRAWDPVWDIIKIVAAAPWRGLWKLRRELAYQ